MAGYAPIPALYDNDTHFYYTYYLARLADFSTDDALRIASANVALDYDPQTEPFQKAIPTPAAQSVRLRFHAFVPSLTMLNGESVREMHRRAAYERAWDSGNPGGYLHFYMDIFAHDGFGALAGHVASGHLPDFLSRDPADADRMTRGALSLLWEFRTRQRNQHAQPFQRVIGPAPRPVWTAAEQAALEDAYKRARPVLAALIAENSASFRARPDATRARWIVFQALKERVPDLSDRIRYRFNRNGYPAEPTLYSVLAPRVRQMSAKRAGSGTRLEVPVERLFPIDAALRSRIRLNGRIPQRVALSGPANATVVLSIDDPGLTVPGGHRLSIDNPGPEGRTYRSEVTFRIDPQHNLRQQGSGRSVLIRVGR